MSVIAAIVTTVVLSAKHRAVRVPTENFIDTWIMARETRDGVTATTLSGDEEFLRRVTLDLTGRIPTAAEVDAFLSDNSPDKRAHKIDALLESDAFVDRWTMWFGDLVQNVQAATNTREYYPGRNAYYAFIRESFRTHKPYDQLVREVLAGEGDSFSSGAANYVVRQLQRNGPPQDTYDNLAAHSAEKFLGIPMLCISCHSGAGHLELVNWYLRGRTREDFWKMAAFFARTQVRAQDANLPDNPNIRKYLVTTNERATYRLNTTGGNKTPRQPLQDGTDTIAPAFILTGEQPRTGEPYRVAYGRMLTADRQFARNTVNQLWREMFGRGLVEPLNGFDLTKLDTQPTHPELLDALAGDFIAGGYDVRALLRTIALSRTYQLASRYTPGVWNEAWTVDYVRHEPRRLMAEPLLDAIVSATGVAVPMSAQGIGAVDYAMKLPDPTDGRRAPFGVFLATLGRGNRDDVARTNDSTIAQALAMMNDPLVVNRVHRSVQNLLATTNDPDAIVDRLYVATLSRHPTSGERTTALAYLRDGNLADRAVDLQFASQ